MSLNWNGAGWRLYGVAVVVLFLMSSGASVAGSNNTNGGVSSGQLRALSAAWWQWALSIPAEVNPLAVDDTLSVDFCGVGQHGDVWFLGGSFVSADAMRECTIPAGKAIFFPIVNAECSEIEGDGSTLTELGDCAAGFMDLVTEVDASVDGVPLRHVERSRVQSGLFSFALPPNDVLGLFGDQPNPSKSVSDGWWILLKPLSAGDHTVSFHANVPAFSFELNIDYDLQVVD